MQNDLKVRSQVYFENSILIAATFMDPRYRSFKFIEDQDKRDQTFSIAYNYIKNVSLSMSPEQDKVPQQDKSSEPANKKSKKSNLHFTLLYEEESDSDAECGQV